MADGSYKGKESDNMEVNLSEISRLSAQLVLVNKLNEFLTNVPADAFKRCYMYVSYDTSEVYYNN